MRSPRSAFRLTASLILVVVTTLAATACGGEDPIDKVVTKKYTIGEAATVTDPFEKTTIEVTVDAVQGSKHDLDGFNFSAKERSSTPWFVTTTIKNPGKEIPKSKMVGAYVDVEDDAGLQLKEIHLIGDFKKCQLKNPQEPFPAGAENASCSTYLVGKNAKLRRIVLEKVNHDGSERHYIWKPRH